MSDFFLLWVAISQHLTLILSHNHVKIRISMNYKHVSRIQLARCLTEPEVTHVTAEEERCLNVLLHPCGHLANYNNYRDQIGNISKILK